MAQRLLPHLPKRLMAKMPKEYLANEAEYWQRREELYVAPERLRHRAFCQTASRPGLPRQSRHRCPAPGRCRVPRPRSCGPGRPGPPTSKPTRTSTLIQAAKTILIPHEPLRVPTSPYEPL